MLRPYTIAANGKHFVHFFYLTCLGAPQKCSREGPLLEALNAMEHEHHVAAAVIMQLQEKLVAATSVSLLLREQALFIVLE